VASDLAVISFSSQRYPKPLAHALAQSQSEPEDAYATYLSPEDNDWGAPSLLVEFLLNATPRRAPLDRERASAILGAGTSQVTVDHLEARGFLRFVLGRLRIPQAVSVELAFGKHADQLSEVERTALKQLDQARQDKTAPLWVAKGHAERIHLAHTQAHRRTPSLEALCDSHVLAHAKRGDAEGYDLLLNDRESSLWRSYLGSRVLGLYWEELVREKPLALDDEQFDRWLDVALEICWWTQAPRWMRTSQDRKRNFRTRLVEAATRRIIKETDLIDGQKELERIRWDHDGFGFHGMPDLPPLPGPDESLHLLYEWWSHGHFECTQNRCREELDALISLVVFYDQAPWAHRVVELLEASRERPYLMYAIRIQLLLGSREAIAGLIANLETASVGMHLLTKLTVADETPVRDWELYRDEKEARKTKIWREAVSVLLGTLHGEVQEGHVQAAARVLAETLIVAAKSVLQRHHLPAEEEGRRRGSEARLDVLLGELRRTDEHVLFKLARDLHELLAEQARKRLEYRDFAGMPIADMRILFWLLRTVLSAGKAAVLNPMKVAETLLSIYGGELRRETTADGSKIVSWLDDAPEVLSLPWLDLAVFLHQRGLDQLLIEPRGVDFADHLRNVPATVQVLAIENKSSAEYQLSSTWVRKTRLHVRLLMCIHESTHGSVFDPVLGLTSNQHSGLVALVEQRLWKIVQACVTQQHASGRESLFEPDNDYHPEGVRSAPGLLKLLVHTFNCFSGERRNRAFADWMDAEDAPDVLLTVLDEALPREAKQRAASRLKSVDLDQFLTEQRRVTRIEQVAEAAALVPDQTAIVEKVLAYGDKIVRSGYKQKWESFAFRMRLMVAYHKKNSAELEQVPAPDHQRVKVDGHLFDPAEDTRSFYRALLLIEDQPEQARSIFDDLLRRRPGSASDALNRFSASVRSAERIAESDERGRAFLRALHDWEEVAPSIPAAALADVRTGVAYLRLASFDGAQKYENFDAAWSSLDAAQRAEIEFVALGVNNARRRDLQDRVERILEHARPYHTDHDAKIEKRFAQIAHSVEIGKSLPSTHVPVAPTPGDNIEARRRIYQELPRVRADEAVRVVGEKDVQLHEFLADRLYVVAAEALDRIVLLARLKTENQYNDVMVSLLKMRLKFLGWEVAQHPRGGYSETGKDAGERDWEVRDSFIVCAIFEALRLDKFEKGKIDKHVEKAVSQYKYNKIGVPRVYIIVYYHGPLWSDFWTKYWGHVQNLSVSDALPIRKSDALPTAVGSRSLHMAQIVYNDGSGVPLYVYHLAMNMNGG
jgi:hypothetical protein